MNTLTAQQSKLAQLSYYAHKCISLADSLDVGKTDDDAAEKSITRHELITHFEDAIAILPELYE